MNCKYLIGICSKTRLPCPHCAVDGRCDEASCTNAVIPTWNELIDIYRTAAKPKAERLKNIRSAINTLTRTLGTSLDEKVAVTDEQIDAAYSALLTDHSPYTIEGMFCAVKAVTSRRRDIKLEYRRRGKQVPEFDFPEVKKRKMKIVTMTDGQRLAVKDKIVELRKSKNPADRSRFLWLWFAWNFGMRMKDIENIRWECLTVHSNGSWWLDYVPTKTSKTGKRAGCRLSEEQVEEIRPFIGNSEDYVIPRHADRRPKRGKVKVTHGEFVGHHGSLRRYFIGFMRSIGIEDNKPQYAIRKEVSQRIISTSGILHEAQLLGHTPKVAMTHYTDISKLELKEGL